MRRLLLCFFLLLVTSRNLLSQIPSVPQCTPSNFLAAGCTSTFPTISSSTGQFIPNGGSSTVSVVPNGQVIQWTQFPLNVLTGSPSLPATGLIPSITVQPAQTQNCIETTVYARFLECNCYLPIKLNTTAQPSTQIYWRSSLYEGPGCFNAFSGEQVSLSVIDPNSSVNTYKWTIVVQGSSEIVMEGLGLSNIDVNPTTLQPQDTPFNVYLSVTSPCFPTQVVRECGGYILYNGGNTWSISPNPADETLTVQISDEAVQSTATGATTTENSTESPNAEVRRRYHVVSTAGRVVQQGEMPGKTASVSLSGLPAGTYHLILFENEKLVSRKTFFKK